MIFSFGIMRDHLYVRHHHPYRRSVNHGDVPSLRYQRALQDQPQQKLLPAPYDTVVPAVLFGLGQLFVVTSTWALGVTGTFLGDYFGILMDHRVEGFPFNVLRDPMYVGSTMCFAATALWYVQYLMADRLDPDCRSLGMSVRLDFLLPHTYTLSTSSLSVSKGKCLVNKQTSLSNFLNIARSPI